MKVLKAGEGLPSPAFFVGKERRGTWTLPSLCARASSVPDAAPCHDKRAGDDPAQNNFVCAFWMQIKPKRTAE
ncbi:MAG: hypothetical protein ACK5TR_01130 [Alphaproteobacteria bacterium]